MITHPSSQDILQAITQWIEDLRPQLDERNAFLARVSIHALATVRRELVMGPSNDSLAVAEMARLLGLEGSYEVLTRELCVKLREGELDMNHPGLLTALRAMTMAQLQIDQPEYKHCEKN